MDFKEKAARLIPYTESILSDICPGGKRKGHEYIAGNIYGGQGRSFSFNLDTGKWADFSSGDKGSDIVALYAAVKATSQGEALKLLEEQYLGKTPPKMNYPTKTIKKPQVKIIKPPQNTERPGMFRYNQEPSMFWTYTDEMGDPLFYIARYDVVKDDGTSKKEFLPYTFSSSGKWVLKQWPGDRPLYKQHLILENPDKHVLIVEGEKACDAAVELTKAYVCTSWCGGAGAWGKTDFSILKDRKVLLWPDADEAGRKAMALLSRHLEPICSEIKIIDPDRNDGWDAADALAEGGFKFSEWAKPRVSILESVTAERPIVKHKAESLTDVIPFLMIKENGEPYANEANVKIILNHFCDETRDIWFDEFESLPKTTLFLKGDETSRVLDKKTQFMILTDIMQTKFSLTTLNGQKFEGGLYSYLGANIRNELKDRVRRLTWDGVNRIDTMLHRIVGCDDNEYTRAVSKNVVLGMIKRIIIPGSKFDYMLILEGEQGTRKSTFCEELFDKEYYATMPTDFHSEEFPMFLRGKVIVEVAELSRFKKGGKNIIKDILSRPKENLREKYERYNLPQARTCIFIGTTNEDMYLEDETGNRRFWPIVVNGEIDIDALRAEREQLWAEAVVRINAGEECWQVPANATQEQAKRLMEGDIESVLKDWLEDQEDPANADDKLERMNTPRYWFSNKDIKEGLVKIGGSRYNPPTSTEINKSMRKFGYISKRNLRRYGRRKLRDYWVRPENINKDKEEGETITTTTEMTVKDGEKRVFNHATKEWVTRSVH
jgi:hypothetical protein